MNRSSLSVSLAVLVLCACDGGSSWAPGPLAERTDHGTKVIASTVSRDGQLLATADLAARVVVHSMRDGAEVVRFDDKASRRIVGLAFHPDGKRLFSATAVTLRCYDARTGELIQEYDTGLETHENDVIVIGMNGSREGKSTWVTGHVRELGLSPDGQWLLAFVSRRRSSDGDPAGLVVWDVETGEVVASDAPGDRLCVHPERPVVAVHEDGATVLLDLPDLAYRTDIPGTYPLGFSGSGHHLLVAARSPGALRVYDADGSTLVCEVAGRCDEAAISPDDRVLLHVAGFDAVIRDLDTGAELWRASIDTNEASPSMAFLPARGAVLLAPRHSHDKPEVILHDLQTGQPIGGIELGPCALTSLNVTPGGDRLAVGVFEGKTCFYPLD